MKTMRSVLACVSAALMLAASFASAAEDPIPPPAHPAIWRIENGAGRVYLFGSLHILPTTLSWVSPEIDQAMKASDDFVFEVPVDGNAIITEKDFIVHNGLLPRGLSLHVMLPAAEYQTYASVLRRAGLKEEQFDRYKPWLAGLVLGLVYLHADNFTALRGADDVLLDYARAQRKDTQYFETIEQQMSLLTATEPKAQLEAFRSLVATLPQAREHEQEMLEAWSAGDTDRFAHIIDNYFAGHEMAKDFLIGARNRTWLPRIEELLKAGKTSLVTVGAAHIGGSGGLLEALCAKGYDVERIGSGGQPSAKACGPRA